MAPPSFPSWSAFTLRLQDLRHVWPDLTSEKQKAEWFLILWVILFAGPLGLYVLWRCRTRPPDALSWIWLALYATPIFAIAIYVRFVEFGAASVKPYITIAFLASLPLFHLFGNVDVRVEGDDESQELTGNRKIEDLSWGDRCLRWLFSPKRTPRTRIVVCCIPALFYWIYGLWESGFKNWQVQIGLLLLLVALPLYSWWLERREKRKTARDLAAGTDFGDEKREKVNGSA